MIPPINSPNTAGCLSRSNSSPPSFATSNIAASPIRTIGCNPCEASEPPVASVSAYAAVTHIRIKAAVKNAFSGLFIKGYDTRDYCISDA